MLYAPTGLGPILYHLVYIGPMLYAGGGLYCMPQQVLGQSCITSYTLGQRCIAGAMLYDPTGLGPILYHLVYIGPMLYFRRGPKTGLGSIREITDSGTRDRRSWDIPNGNKDHVDSRPSPEQPKMHSGPPRTVNVAKTWRNTPTRRFKKL